MKTADDDEAHYSYQSNGIPQEKPKKLLAAEL
jgi:hypothetical protein